MICWQVMCILVTIYYPFSKTARSPWKMKSTWLGSPIEREKKPKVSFAVLF